MVVLIVTTHLTTLPNIHLNIHLNIRHNIRHNIRLNMVAAAVDIATATVELMEAWTGVTCGRDVQELKASLTSVDVLIKLVSFILIVDNFSTNRMLGEDK